MPSSLYAENKQKEVISTPPKGSAHAGYCVLSPETPARVFVDMNITPVKFEEEHE